MKCPWCEEEMQAGKLTVDGRSRPHFQPEGVKYTVWELLAGIGVMEAATYKWGVCMKIPAHYCTRCKRMVIETEVTK